MRIMLDTLSGEMPASEIILGGVSYLQNKGNAEITFIGNKEEILAQTRKHRLNFNLFDIITAAEKITMKDGFRQALRKKDSSLFLALRRAAEFENSAFISPGNTAAIIGGVRKYLTPINSIDKAPLAVSLPNLHDRTILLLDVGATSDCTAENLHQFSLLGKAYAENIMNRKNPTLALLSNGEEDYKGNKVVREAANILTKSAINHSGFIEPNNVFYEDRVDVIVCDGFLGNSTLKAYEGAANLVLDLFKREAKGSIKVKIGGKLLKSTFQNIKKEVKSSYYGGAVLLGINRIVIVCHGQAAREAIENACFRAEECLKQNLVEKIEEGIKDMEGKKPN